MGVTRVTEGLLAVLAVFMHAAICNGSPEKGYSPLSFTHHLYNATIYENTAPKTYIESSIKMGIYITDPLWSIKYKLVSGDDDSLFKIEDYTVGDFSFLRIRTRSGNTASLNREVRDSYTLTIQSSESTYEYEARTKVVIRVLDANDLKPLFSPASYSVTVGEDTPLKSSVVKVRATDADLGSNAQFYYSFTRRSQTFVVNPSTGEIALAKKLNHTQASKYELVVLAEDRVKKIAGIRGYGNVARVVVNVEKVTPLPPVIKSVEVATPGEDRDLLYATVITEAGRQGLQVESVAIVAGDPLNYFKVMPSPLQSQVYQVVMAKKVNWLSYPFGFNLSLQAKDKSNPPLSSLIKNIHIPSPKSAVLKFEKEVYHVMLSEFSPPKSPVVQIKVMPNHANTSYHLASNQDNSKFKINPRSGLIVTTENMDYEKKSRFELDVMTAHGEAKARVVVDIIDENDNAPKFSQSSYKGTVSENEPIGTSILRVTAVDSDRGENGFITYAIANRGPLPFTIHPFTGVISISEKLDYEMMQRWYHLRIWASDSGIPFSHVTESSVSIVMNNVNDNIPMFEKVGCNVTIPQSLSPGDRFGIMSAVDLDELQQVRYEIVSGNELGLFELNSVSGMLLLKKSIPLAYPADVMPLYILKITATDGENYAQPTDINITVIDNNEPASMNCEDTGVFKKLAEKLIQSIKPKLPLQEEDTFSDIHIINHHSPKFDAALPRSLDIKEDTAVNSTILQFKASDQDSGFNGKLVYVIFDGSEDGTFIVDMDTGDLKVHAPLDRETTGFYILNITVYDLGTPQKSSWKLLAVNIIDANDNPPRFNQSSYFLTVPEDAAVETSIFQLKSTDIDLEDNGRVQYSFLTSTDRFSINELTGVVRVTRPLDRETCPTYKLKIEARDQASADPQLFSTADLLVAVQDVNDNPPSFVPKIYKIQVPEDLPIGTLVLWVEGIDPDLGPAGEIIYNLVNNENRAFQLETSTGALSVEKELDFEKKPFYNLTVRAVDHGRPRALSSSCYVEVEVLDVNENLHTPRFSSFVFKGAVSEDASVGTSVIALTALDEDSGRDGEVRYFIKDGSGLGVFSIEAETGIIRVADTLDRESTPHYWLTVYVTDLGSVPLVSWTEVFIEVMDVNDNPPVLSLPVYYASVLENSPKDMSILRVEASDPDFSSEGKLSFRITDTQRAFFTINPKTGVISSTALLLDREEREEHILEVVVDDNGSPPLQSTATVVIQVLDVNDQTPRFTHKLSTVRLPECHGVTEPEALYRMIAQDLDQGSNAEITYSLEEDSEKTKFTIHPGSGTVWSRSDFSPGEYSILTIKATDGGSPAKSSTARLHIEWVPKPAPSSEPLAFDEPHFNFAVMETDPVTHMVGIISTDISQSLLWFDITGGDSEQEFDIEKNSGSIVIARPLNAGRRSNYNLTVRATDGTKAIKTQAYIRVVDINEHRPQFLKSQYEVRVPEDTPPWKEILQMSATDADGSNRLVYTIHSSVDPASLKHFQLNPSSGTLVTTATLDHETLSVHTLTVMVRDQEVPVKRNFVKVIVYVEDCNDHPPSFMSSRYEGSVLNLAAIGIEVVQVKAMDKDKGNNAEMIYTFHSGNTESAFSIDPESGKITVAKPLDQLSQERYHLTVKATDQGFPQLRDLTTVNIQVKLSDYTPPKFSMMEYFAEISEAAHVGSPVITLSATSPTTVSYEIKDGNPNGTFQVNYYSGVLTVQKPLDFENVFSYRLCIRAANLAGSFAEAVVFVYVIDENDNAPAFLQSEFTGQISESVHLNSMVMGKKNTPLVIKATDADKESNALLVYKILEPEAQKYFRIEPSTGTLATAASIDFEVIPVFHFTVQVHDSGTPSLYADKPARVTVHVLNVNDCPPKFAEHLYESSLCLPAFFGMEVIKVTAVDADSDVTYSINEGNLHSAFTINPTTGLVSVNNASNLSTNYQLMVKASDGLYKDTALVKINVTDITTSGLGFEQKAYTASVLENSTAIQTLAVVRASGNYLNEPLFYSVLNPTGRFRIVQTSGVLQTTGVPFDREQKDLYDVVVQVRDTRRPPRAAHTHVKVYIEDINDNAPEFVNLPYSMAVQDDAEPGDVLFQVTAVDKDLGDNKAVVYSLADDFALFRIDPYLGDVSLRRPFDFETLNAYKLAVIAADRGNPPLIFEAELVITVRNKSNPIFQSLHYGLKVPENISPYTALLHIQARNPEGFRVIYNLVEENASRTFNIDFKSGILSVTDFLDYETQTQHVLTVRATDAVMGTFSEATVAIEVEDINDNPPLFQKTVYTAEVFEGSPIGTSVLQVHASDKDSGRNKAITYEINSSEFFDIDAVSGQIVTTQELDYETIHQFHLKVKALDNGVPPMTSEALVIVNVSDVNDNPPEFTQPQYEATLSEMATCGQIVIKVQASDPDAVDANNLEYVIFSGNDDRHFAINKTSGIISFSNVCKRSLDPFYNLTVSVSDGVFKKSAPVNIDMMTANKHSPYFDQSIYEAELAENAEVGTQVIRLAAIDPDAGPYGSVDYTIINMLAEEKFSIDNKGQIVTSHTLDRENPTERVIAIKVMAKDGGGKVAFCTVKIILTDENDNAPQFKASEYHVSIQSNVSKGSPVIQIMAYDADEGTNADVTYFVDEAEEVTEEIIEINPFTGVVTIKESLIGLENKIFNFKVKARDGGSPHYNTSVPVQVQVVPSEVPLPRFSEPLYTFSAAEDLPTGSEIGSVRADANEPVIYSLVEGNTVESNKERVFALDKESGALVVRDQEVPVKRNFVKVIVYVEDCNDHPPSFMSSRYEGSVLNLAAIGIEVVQVKAMDKDKGNNAEMIYTFHSGNTESAFSIDPESGKITVAKPLDQLSQERYHLTVKATDQGFPQLRDLTTVNIQVKLSDYTPPKFSMMEYFAEISEAAHVGSPVITLSATSPTTVSYEIKDGNPNGTFQVNYYSGVLTVQKPLDFENVFSYRLCIRAANLAGSFAEAVVFVYVIDENDNAPAFLQSEFTGQISESVHLNSMVMGKKNTPLVIKATDADKESNALLVYKILEPEAQKYFRIEPSTGTLATAASIDFEVIPVFHFTVQVHDSGTPSLYADKPARVTVHVLNVNDCPPKFAEHLYESSLCLPAFFGMEVIKVTAVDADSDVTYSINEGNLHSAFTINPTTGLVSVNNASNLSTNYQLMVKASDGLYKDTALVKINVTDITTSGLGFEQKAYTASVLENSTAIQTLAVVRASGNYLNEPLFYSVLNPTGRFRIVQTSGVLQTTGVPFDREQKDLYDVVVQVRDTRRPPRAAHTHVKVYIEDINDNAPEFVNLPYSMAVQDDAEPGDVLFQVTAVDKDLGDNKAVVYSLADDFALFRIDPYLGDVSLRRPFDFETLNAYKLAVIAADRGNPPLIFEAELVITVRNKSNPIFQSLHYGLKVPENISPYTALLHIQARNPEGFRVIYNLVEENASRTFNIDFKSGILSVTDFLDYETQTQHVLTVRATDAVMGTFSEATVAIEVEDINDNPPLFQKTVYTAEVFEGSPIGTSVLQVHASDKDSGRNKAITYEINSSEFFDIDAVSGQIVTTQELDYETIHQFHLKVKALDNGVPPMTSEALVIVNVSDVNDNPPEFTQPQYEATLSEMATCGQIVIKVQASDPDAVDANNLEYVIFSGNDDRHFAINKTSGIISFSNVCKRSLDPFYNLTVSVSDGVFKKSAPVNIDMMTANKHSPYFDQSIYEAELAENAEVGTQVIRLAAIDPDAGPYGSVDYTIINMLAEEKFSIDNKGQIVTSHTLDRENPTERVIAIKVMAKDGGGKVAFCTVKIILTDENDNAPQFKASEYHVSIQSNVSKGSPVIQIMAYDADEGTNADVTYFVDEAEEVTEEIIEINPFTGVVTIKESLIGLENKIFNFKVKARDGGSPHYNTSVPVQVQVVPSEVPLPRFSEPLYTFSAAEDLPTGSEIGSVRADANEPVIYSLVEGNTVESNKERVFALDKESGALVVQKNIDHEKTKWYQVDVMAHCNHNGTDLASLVSVSIQVQDVNDNQPVFEANPYKAFLVENMPAGTTVIQVTAIDPDTETNGEVTYRLEPETDDFSEVFTIDSESGWITSLKETDCESRGRYSFYVVATDHGGKVKLSSSALVEVTITDENDNPPQFTEDVYKGAVVENSQPGQVITALSTRDADVSEDNRQTTCYITDGDPLGQFSVEQVDGEWRVTLQGEIDREEKEKYLLRVTATDGRFQVTTAVEIHVLDINDNSPLCQQVLYTETVSEDAPAGFFILKVSAKDPDHGTNGQVTYTLHGPSADKFRLDSQTGGLYTLATLDREQEMEYDLVVKATDGGGRSCQTDILLAIKDVNDNPPKFSSNHYVVTVFDNTTVKTPIAVVHAKDPDSGINSEVMYSLIDSAGDYFSVDEFSGILRLEKTLSDEPQSTFELKVKANDLGLPRYLTSVATVTVNVVDLSDYLPVFLHSEYTTAIPEGSALGAEVLSVSALTRDGAQNVVILYDIISGNEHGKFSIDSKTGLLSVNGTLDFEQCNEYYLSVEGVRRGSSSLSDITMVIINITDMNDNLPRFSHAVYSTEVSEDISLGSAVIAVSADDLDGPLNNQIRYSIESGDPQQHFSIDPESGEIRLSRHLDREELSSFTLKVQAEDNGAPPQFSIATVTVKVSDVNDNPPVFFQLNYSLLIQEGSPVGSSVLRLMVTDRDTPPNGPPFSFRITAGDRGKEFHIDSEGLLTSVAILRRRTKEEYLLQVQVTDSGYPPLSSSTFIKISIIEQSQYPPSAVPLEIFITTANEVFSGRVLGKIHATDQDLHDVLSYKLLSESPPSHSFTVSAADGKIIARDLLEPGQYTLNVSVTDGKFTTPAAVHISVWGATQHALEQGVTLKLAGMTPEEFISDHWRNLQRYLGNTLGVQRQGVHIASLQQEPTSLVLDVLLVLKQLDSPAAKAHLLTSMLPSSVQEIEDLLGMQITNMKHGFCKGPSCPPAGCKSTVRMDAKSVSTYATARISFITPQHVWEVVCSCNESAVRFSGNSYLQYQYLNTLKNNHLRLSLRLKTHQLQGMVMATNGTDTGALEVINGELKFEYSCGRTPPKTLGVRNVTVSDGRWHRVLLEVNGTVLRLSLNKIHSTSIMLAAPCRLLQSQGSLVFGGLVQEPPADRSWQVQVQRGFRGCLDALELNGEAINSTAKAGVQMPGERKVSGIYQCCSQSESCTSDPCRNGGACQDTSTGEFLCSCTPQYFGSRCEIADNPCLSNPCLHGRQCVPSSKGYLCHCPQPDTGNRCEDYVDVCHSSPCPSGFDCKTSNTTYHCTETLKIEISSDSQFGVREIIEIFAVVLGVLILVGVFVFSRKRYLRQKKHKPINMHDPDSLFQPNVAKSMDWNDQELPPIEMNAMPEPRNDLDQENALTLKARGQPDFTPGGGQIQKQRGTVVCSVAPNLPPRPPSSSDNESILKNNWELEYDVYPGDPDYYCPPVIREYEIVEEPYPPPPPVDPHQVVQFAGFPFPLEHYDRRAPLPPRYSNQNLDDFLGPNGLSLAAPHCPNEYTAISYYPTERSEGLDNLAETGYRRLSMRLSVAQPSYADCGTSPQNVTPMRTPRSYESSDMVESDYGSCEEVMF